MAVSEYINTFGEPASNYDLEHLYDNLNQKNDDRITFRDFVQCCNNAGFRKSSDDIKSVFDHISSITNTNHISKKAFINGVDIAHENALTEECYHHIISGGQYDPQPGRDEIDLNDIQKALKDTKATWIYRVECMESLSRQLTVKSLSADKFHSIFRGHHIGMTKQLRDRRSNVMRVACQTEAKLIARWKKEFQKYGSTLIEYTYELVRVKIDVVNKMGKRLLVCLVKNCPDKSSLAFLERLGDEANTSKYANLKKDCFDVLVEYFHHQTESLKNSDDFWNKLMDVTKKGVEDVGDIRNAALHLLAAIQTERHDLAFPIIKNMNDHLRKRYEAEYQISRGTARGRTRSPKKRRVPIDHDESPYEFKNDEIGGGTKVTMNREHMRKHTWSTNDLIAGFAAMQLKQQETLKKKKKEKKDKTKTKAKFPEPPAGQFFNPFGESVTPKDIQYAFEFIDYRNNRRITLVDLQVACEKMNVENVEQIFSYLDAGGNHSVDFGDWKQALSERHAKCKAFWLRVLGGNHLQDAPRVEDFGLEEASKLLSDTGFDQNTRILALHSITRRLCTKLSEDKFHKLFKKCIANLLLQLQDRKSYVVRETCVCLAKVMIARRAQFIKFALRTLEALYEIIRLNDDKMHTSAHQAAKVLIRFIPDSKKFPIFAIVAKGCTDKQFATTRVSSFEYVNHVLARMVQVDQERNDRFWNYVQKVLASGLADVDQSVRDAACSALAKTEILRPDHAAEHVAKLRKSQRDKYFQIKQYVVENIQEEDFGSEGPGLLIALGSHTRLSSNHSGTSSVGNNSDYESALSPRESPSKKSRKRPNRSRGSGDSGNGNHLGITSNSRFTLTPQGFAKEAQKYRDADDLKSKSRRARSTGAPKAPKAGRKSKKNIASTTDVLPSRERGSNKSNEFKRPHTARIERKKKTKSKTNSMVRNKSKGKKGKKQPQSKMSMQDQARQALCVTAHKALVQAFIEQTEDLTGTLNFGQFRECLEKLKLEVGKGDALKAFSELDEDKEQALNMEQFGHAVHVAYPEYDLLWKQLGRSKYRYYATLEDPMTLDEIKSVIVDKKSAWPEKTRAMRCACTMVCDFKRKEADVVSMIKKLIDPLVAALRSNNQVVVREACITVATMAKERTGCMKGVVGRLLKTCWELLDVKIPLIRFSASECLKIVIKYVPDDADNKYLKTLIQGTKLGEFESVRNSCYECIIVMILRAGTPSNGRMSNAFWNKIRQIIVEGVESQEEEVREYGYHCLYAFEKVEPQRAQRLLNELDDETVAEYQRVVSGDVMSERSPSPTHSVSSQIYMPQHSHNSFAPPSASEAEPELDERHLEPGASPGGQTDVPSPNGHFANHPEQPPAIATGQVVTTPNGDEDEKGLQQQQQQQIPPPYDASKRSNSEGMFKIELETPVPTNEELETGMEERTKQIREVYEKLDENGEGWINRFKAMTFLQELMKVNMRNAEIILSGLDRERTDKFSEDILTEWTYAHSPEMDPNPLLQKKAMEVGWVTLTRPGLEKRVELYSSLLQLEKSDKNYSMVYELDMKICILLYLLKHC